MNFVYGFIIGAAAAFATSFFAICSIIRSYERKIKELEEWIKTENWKPDLPEPKNK